MILGLGGDAGAFAGPWAQAWSLRGLSETISGFVRGGFAYGDGGLAFGSLLYWSFGEEGVARMLALLKFPRADDGVRVENIKVPEVVGSSLGSRTFGHKSS